MFLINPFTHKKNKEDFFNVAIIAHDAFPAGSQKVLLSFLKELKKRINKKIILLLCKGGELETEYSKFCQIIYLEKLKSKHGTIDQALERFSCFLNENNIKFILCNTVVTAPIAIYLAKRKFQITSFIHELPTSIEIYSSPSEFKEMVQNSTLIITVSNYVKRKLIERYKLNESKIKISYAGVSDSNNPSKKSFKFIESSRKKLRKDFNLKENDFLILGCGSIHPRKGADLFVSVAKIFYDLSDLKNVKFIWVGSEQQPGYLNWLEHDIEVSKLNDKILFLGQKKDTFPYYNASDIFLLTSREDPFPQVCLEAMANNLPVIYFKDSTGSQEILSDAGIETSYLNTYEMALQLNQILKDPERRNRLINFSKKRITEELSWSRFSQEILSFVKAN